MATLRVRLDGRTDLHNYYSEAFQRRDQQATAGGANGTYTLKRTRTTAKRVARVHALVAKACAHKVYLITHTVSSDYVPRHRVGEPGESRDRVRRRLFRSLLDRIRKEPLYRGHFWTTELHGGGGANEGTIHHHLAVRMAGYWAYKCKIKEWSKRYSGSVNGLDVSPPQHANRSYGYVTKAFRYMTKSAETAELPFRWWGTSEVARSWRQDYDDTYLLPSVRVVEPGRNFPVCARVPAWHAIMSCARIVVDKESRRDLERRKRLLNIAAPQNNGATP